MYILKLNFTLILNNDINQITEINVNNRYLILEF